MKDTLKQEVKEGDTVVFVPSYSRAIKVGVLIKVTPKGRATIGYSQYSTSTKPHLAYSRTSFMKVSEKGLDATQRQTLKQIRDFYGYTRG